MYVQIYDSTVEVNRLDTCRNQPNAMRVVNDDPLHVGQAHISPDSLSVADSTIWTTYQPADETAIISLAEPQKSTDESQ